MKIPPNTAGPPPRPEPRPATRNAVPVSESSRPLPQPSKLVESRSPVDNPLKGERVTTTAAAAVRTQRIQPTPDRPPPPAEPKRIDSRIGSHNANPGTQAYERVATAARGGVKGGRVDTSA